MSGISHLIQLTAALEDQLGRTEQEKDRTLRHMRQSERRREKSELLCQLKLQESALLLQELSEQLLAAKRQSADLQRQLQQQQLQQVGGGNGQFGQRPSNSPVRKQSLSSSTASLLSNSLSPEKARLVEAEELLPKIDLSAQVQGKGSFSAGKVMRKQSGLLATSKSDNRLPSRGSTRFILDAIPPRSLTPSAIQSIVGTTAITDGK